MQSLCLPISFEFEFSLRGKWGHTGLLVIVTKPCNDLCQEMENCKILGLTVMLKNDKSNFHQL